MQLHYNIIWIDDEIDEFKNVGDLDRVVEFLKDLGFTPAILPLKEGKEIEKHFANRKHPCTPL